MSHEWRGPGVDILLDRLQPFAGRLMPWVVLMATSTILCMIVGICGDRYIIYTKVNVSMTFMIYIVFVHSIIQYTVCMQCFTAVYMCTLSIIICRSRCTYYGETKGTHPTSVQMLVL